MTIHDQIDEMLAADLHEQLNETERQDLHAHLIECAVCRQIHKEHQAMNRILNDTFEEAKPDAKFEQHILGAFRARVPDRGPGVLRFLVLAMRSRATQIAAAAALLLALVQTGRLITGERAPYVQREERSQNAVAKLSDNESNMALPSGVYDDLKKSSEIAGVAQSESKAEAPPSPARPKEFAAARRAITTPGNAAVSGTRADVETSSAGAPAMPQQNASPVTDNRKLIRTAAVDLEVASFDEATQKITAFANEERGYVATSSSQKQENGKLRGELVVKLLPENLDRFLGKLRGLGELKNQSVSTQDVTKQYVDIDSRLRNARAMEQRLLDILNKKSSDISDLLQVEKELGRVREEIEMMQADLKSMDAQVQFATVTIRLAEKEMNEPAAFLLKESAQLALFAPEVEKTYNEIKALASPKVQITSATLDRDNYGRVSARVAMLIAPEESDGVIAKTKSLARVENFQVQTERVAHGGEGMSENARTDQDKVQLNVTISREEQEQSLQQTSLRIRTNEVNDRAKQLRELAAKNAGRVRSSSFSRDPNGREFANVSLRVPMKNYTALMQSLNSLGEVQNVSVTRQDRGDAQIDEQNAPADVSIQVYSQGNIVSPDTGLIATLRRTIAQGAAALMWSVRMIGVALAFFAPWILALAAAIWGVRRIRRNRKV